MAQARTRPTRAALIDFDMTLVDTVPAILEATNLFAAEMGLRKVTNQELLANIGLPLEDTWKVFWGGYDPGWPRIYQERYRSLEAGGFRLFPDTVATLEALRAADLKTALVTNRARAPLAVANVGLAGYFDAVVGADDVPRPKPFPDPLWRALELVGVDRSLAVYAGDTAIDMDAAVRAGIDGVGVATGPAGEGELLGAGARWVIGSLSGLLPIVGAPPIA
jgi:HAD superfamily hydrolase (TIGR01509 family)